MLWPQLQHGVARATCGAWPRNQQGYLQTPQAVQLLAATQPSEVSPCTVLPPGAWPAGGLSSASRGSPRSLCFASARAKSRKSCKSGSNYRETLDPIWGRNMGLFLWTGSAPKGCSLTLVQLTQQLLSLSSQHEQRVMGLKPGPMSCARAAQELRQSSQPWLRAHTS